MLLKTQREENKILDKKKKKLKLVERIQVIKNSSYKKICQYSMKLYNQATHIIKKTLEAEKRWIHYHELNDKLKISPNYQTLPAQTAQQILRLIEKNWKGFFKSIKEWKEHPEKFWAKPESPSYKRNNEESIVLFTNQQSRIKNDLLYFPKKANLSPIKINKNRINQLQQVRILPKGHYYIIEIVYKKEITDFQLNVNRLIGIDLGLNNIVCVVNNAGLRPFIVKGGAIKAINQYYNKLRAKFQAVKKYQSVQFQTKRERWLDRKRNNKITDLFHKLSRAIINYCLQYNFGTIVIGYNERWKQNCRMGKRNNQNFVDIPFTRLVKQIKYKAELVGISVKIINEDHTSKCSFLDNESIEHHDQYIGRRIKRGLFKSKSGEIINADVNGAYNILRKAFPKAIAADGIEGLGLVPYSVKITELNQLDNLNLSHNIIPNTFDRRQNRNKNSQSISIRSRTNLLRLLMSLNMNFSKQKKEGVPFNPFNQFFLSNHKCINNYLVYLQRDEINNKNGENL